MAYVIKCPAQVGWRRRRVRLLHRRGEGASTKEGRVRRDQRGLVRIGVAVACSRTRTVRAPNEAQRRQGMHTPAGVVPAPFLYDAAREVLIHGGLTITNQSTGLPDWSLQDGAARTGESKRSSSRKAQNPKRRCIFLCREGVLTWMLWTVSCARGQCENVPDFG